MKRAKLSTARPRDPTYARFASFGGFESAEARSAKAESGDPGQQSQGLSSHLWIPAPCFAKAKPLWLRGGECAGMSATRVST